VFELLFYYTNKLRDEPILSTWWTPAHQAC